jgi:hypothetical protein
MIRMSQQIAGAITGYFTQVTVPSQLEVGQDINVSVSFYAINPGALYWKTFLILSSYQLNPNYRLLDAAREIGQEGGRTKTYKLGPMPNENVALSFFLFAHNDAGYDWNWDEFNMWLEGYPVAVTHIASNYQFITPVVAPPQTEVLEVDITPTGSGYVRTTPASMEGRSTWYNGNTGTFIYGTSVQVTAHPYAGYEFEKWSDEIEGGVSYSNPANVKPMTEHRAVKAHFKEIELPPECSLDSDCPEGYVCVGGACVPEEEVPPQPPDEGKKFPLLPVVLIGGGVVVAMAFSKPDKK